MIAPEFYRKFTATTHSTLAKYHYRALMNSLIKKIKVLPQYIIPQHFLSSIIYKIMRCEVKLVKTVLINTITKLYGINIDEALVSDTTQYKSFNHFFTRELKPAVRPIDSNPAHIVSPVDGTVSQAGTIRTEQILQAKNHDYPLSALLANDACINDFINGEFATIYLSPKDYHRIHMPFDGKLRKMIYVPGNLFSVNQATTEEVEGLFAKNERVICLFDTDFGPAAVILVGAIFVSSMETVWAGEITPSNLKQVTSWEYTEKTYAMKKGDELGRFNMGSTVIILLPQGSAHWGEQMFKAYHEVKLGECIAVKAATD